MALKISNNSNIEKLKYEAEICYNLKSSYIVNCYGY